jgi:endonuclease YncB( thermonuclease family)
VVRKLLLALCAVAGALSAAVVTDSRADAQASTAAPPSFAIRANVMRVVDGDTVVVRYQGRSDRVRLIGIDTPEVGQCFAKEATSAMQTVAGRHTVRLVGDRTQARRDRYGRLLAYVVLPDGRDVGRELIKLGAAHVYVYDRPFTRLQSYRDAESGARNRSAGLWGGCRAASPVTTTTAPATTPTTTSPVGNCTPSYPDVCIPPPPPDLDCGQIPFKGSRVRYDVPSPDPHRFDGDRDGIGCEG